MFTWFRYTSGRQAGSAYLLWGQPTTMGAEGAEACEEHMNPVMGLRD